MIDTSILLNYGVLGLWTVTLLIERFAVLKEIKNIMYEIRNIVKK